MYFYTLAGEKKKKKNKPRRALFTQLNNVERLRTPPPPTYRWTLKTRNKPYVRSFVFFFPSFALSSALFSPLTVAYYVIQYKMGLGTRISSRVYGNSSTKRGYTRT